jgi:hypothetical protein
MMNEWGVPCIELWSLLYHYCDRLARKGEHVPDIVLAGGFVLEDQMFKGFALCAPYAEKGMPKRGRFYLKSEKGTLLFIP